MKALLLNGSPHTNGCTRAALNELANTLQAEGMETELVNIGAEPVRGCVACYRCQELGRCVFGDMVNQVAPKLAQADAIVLGSPVYYASPAGGFLAFLDRLFFSSKGIDKTMKVGAAVVSCRRAGNVAAFDTLNKYFGISGMVTAGSQYWNMVYGSSPEEVAKDLEGLQTMRTLGRNIAFLAKSIALGKDKYGLPPKEQAVMTNFHH